VNSKPDATYEEKPDPYPSYDGDSAANPPQTIAALIATPCKEHQYSRDASSTKSKEQPDMV